MKRKEYLKPEMKVFQLKSRTQLLVGSGEKSFGIYRGGSDPEIEDEDDIL